MARTPCSAKVLSHTGCRGQYGQDTPSPHGLDSVARGRPRWCSSALLVRQESVNPLLLASMPPAIDASASGADGSSPAGPLLDIYVDADTACPSRISRFSPQRRCLSRPVPSCLRFFLSWCPPLEILSHPCLSLSVTRLVSSCAASNTLALVPVLECESCSADGSEVVVYCGPPLPRHTLG